MDAETFRAGMALAARHVGALVVAPACVGCRRALVSADALALCSECVRALRWVGPDGCRRCGLPAHGGHPCPARDAPWSTAWAPLVYAGPAAALVRALKFRGALPLMDLMAAHIATNLPAWSRPPTLDSIEAGGRSGPPGPPSRPDLVVPPTPPGPPGAPGAPGPPGAPGAPGPPGPPGSPGPPGLLAALRLPGASGPFGSSGLSGLRRPSGSPPTTGASSGAAVVVPVPAAAARRRRRGFDAAEGLAARVAERLGLPVARLLQRTGGGRQLGAGRATRRASVGLDVSVVTGVTLSADMVLLVDDVHTTGATLRASASILRAAGVDRIHAVTYARTV